MTTSSTSTSNSMRITRNDNVLDDSFIKALDDFRTGYTIRYSLSGVPRPGWHAVAVKVTRRGAYQVRARTGYIGG